MPSDAGSAPKSGKGEGKDAKKAAGAKATPPPPPPPSPLEVLYNSVFVMDKYADTRDARFLARALRYANFIRKWLPMAQLRTAVDAFVTDASRRAVILRLLDTVAAERSEPAAPAPTATAATAPAAAPSMEVEAGAEAPAASEAPSVAKESAPPAAAPLPLKAPKVSASAAAEVEAYFLNVALSMLASQKQFAALLPAASEAASHLQEQNKRTLDMFTARATTYWSLALQQHTGSSAELRAHLTRAHRTACLRHDEYGQAVYINLLLHSLLAERAYEAASKLIAKATFPEAVSNNQLARYLYYKGRVQAVQLEYSDAYTSLLQASRKAPHSALRFRADVAKASVVVQLLTGDIPERSSFTSDAALVRALEPYFRLAKAVRAGDVESFGAVLTELQDVFAADGTLSLVNRLQANVIKTGLRAIALSYSRISLTAIAEKLRLASADDAEFLCAKAIRDGIIDCSLDAEARVLVSREVANVYATQEPQDAFHRRITFCFDVHNEAVKGMRYPPHAHREDLESAEERAAREAEEAELAKDLEDGDFDEE